MLMVVMLQYVPGNQSKSSACKILQLMRAVLQIMMIFVNRMQGLKVIRLWCNAGDILCIESRQTPNEEDKIKENISAGLTEFQEWQKQFIFVKKYQRKNNSVLV